MSGYRTFREFYPFYLSQHQNRTCRRLHFLGSLLALGYLATAVLTANPWWLLGGLVIAYALAWIGHFGFEHNRPATFKYPFYSFAGDWVMFWQILTGRIRL